MEITRIHTENTGGGCMITYVDVKHCDTVVQFGIDEECIVAYNERYGITEDCMSIHYVWSAYSYEELLESLSYEEANSLIKVLIEYCFRFNIHPTFALAKCTWECYQLDYVKRHTRKQAFLDIVEFIRSIDAIAATGNSDDKSLVISIQPAGSTIMVDLDADVYSSVRPMLFELITEEPF
jgi:hypothetical protein